ncbi:MAG: methyltransferase domain-containing protein [Armatimonadetes bacterium]|nr:methyltransferase domain-containing protein [Armatimonadota bacterium]
MTLGQKARLFGEVLRIRLHQARILGVGPDDLVLDLGSGGAPNFRANVLCDRFVGDDTERLGTPLAYPAERPFIIGDAHTLPFADGAFDFVICSHLLEHVADPATVLAELQRVARAGYIETPSRAAEKIHSLPIHRWLVGVEGERLVFEAKSQAVLDAELVDWFEGQLAGNPDFRPLWMKQWQAGLVTQVWWRDRIAAEVRGESAGADFVRADEAVPEAAAPAAAPGLIARVDATYGRWLRRRSQRRAREVISLLACPVSSCRGQLEWGTDCGAPVRATRVHPATGLTCGVCGRNYPVRNGVPVLLPEAAR